MNRAIGARAARRAGAIIVRLAAEVVRIMPSAGRVVQRVCPLHVLTRLSSFAHEHVRGSAGHLQVRFQHWDLIASVLLHVRISAWSACQRYTYRSCS